MWSEGVVRDYVKIMSMIIGAARGHERSLGFGGGRCILECRKVFLHDALLWALYPGRLKVSKEELAALHLVSAVKSGHDSTKHNRN